MKAKSCALSRKNSPSPKSSLISINEDLANIVCGSPSKRLPYFLTKSFVEESMVQAAKYKSNDHSRKANELHHNFENADLQPLNINIESQLLLSKQLKELKESFDINAYQIEISQFPTLSSLASAFNFSGKAICPDPPSLTEKLKRLRGSNTKLSKQFLDDDRIRSGLILSQYPIEVNGKQTEIDLKNLNNYDFPMRFSK